MKWLIIGFMFIISVSIGGCSTIDWDYFYWYSDPTNGQHPSDAAKMYRDGLDRGTLTEDGITEWACNNGYNLDECPPPTPIPVVSPIVRGQPDGKIVPFSKGWWEWYNDQMDKMNDR